MTVIAFTSAKHAPGVTTCSLAFATAAVENGDVVLIEADPAGGDIAARNGLALDPGLASLAAAGRRGVNGDVVTAHTQALPSDVRVLVAPTAPTQASIALRSVGPSLATCLRSERATCVVDLGRFDPAGPSRPLVEAADLLVWVLRPTVEGVEHVRVRLDSIPVGPPLALLLVGQHPYTPADVRDALGVEPVVSVEFDPRAATALSTGSADRWLRRTPLMRSAASLVESVQSLTTWVPS
jgi:hypothetical protein